jgi:hypothetical protein
MKKCGYCGKEYPDEDVRCSIDGEILTAGESEPLHAHAETAGSASPPPLPASPSSGAKPTLDGTWTDRQMRILEVALLCLVAFGGGILSSAHHLSGTGPVGSGVSTLYWLHSR